MENAIKVEESAVLSIFDQQRYQQFILSTKINPSSECLTVSFKCEDEEPTAVFSCGQHVFADGLLQSRSHRR